MLREIQIQDFVIIDHLRMELAERMSVFTGETGAGKSILVGALGLVLGDRAQSAMIRHGCERAEVTAVFDVANNTAVERLLDSQGMGETDGECIIRRQISADGRSRAYLNGIPVSTRVLQELGARLVDIHGQHTHQSLLRRSVQRELLDEFAGHQALLEEVHSAYHKWQEVTAQIGSLCGSSEGQREQQIDWLRYQVAELDDSVLDPAELEGLEREHLTLANLTRIVEGCQIALSELQDEGGGAESISNRAACELGRLRQFDPRLEPISDMLDSAAIQLKETAAELRAYLDGIDIEPDRLRRVEERLTTLHELARKHHTRIEELPQCLVDLKDRLATLEGSEAQLAELRKRHVGALQHFRRKTAELHESRARSAAKLAEAVSSNTREVGMPGARFVIAVEAGADARPSPVGTDRVEFLVSTNPGQPPRELNKVASGGELSRIGLAVQVITGHEKGVPTLVFDEVDVGIGGRIAQIVGERLRRLGEKRQVLCVTHLPQVASQGDHHYRVSKVTETRETRTTVTKLGGTERVDEIARMLGGVKITKQTLAHAEEMLSNHG
jgi:DNA repair protein RecN (Recombination protein N)